MNFPGWTQDIYKTVPPDRSSKMTEQPSTKKTFWRAGVAIATEQPSFVTHSSGKETTFFLFPHILSSIVFFPFSCPATPKLQLVELRTHTWSRKLALKTMDEKRGGT